MRPDPATPLALAAARRHELTRARAIQALRELDRAGAPRHIRLHRCGSRHLPVLALHPTRHPRPDPTATHQHQPRPRCSSPRPASGQPTRRCTPG